MKRSSSKLALALGLLAAGHALAAGETAPSFTLDGVLYDSPGGTHPLQDLVTIRVQILNPAKTCVLYDERQSVDTSTSNGAFTVQVGTLLGSARRTPAVDPGNAMATVYQNRGTINGVGGCAYTPASGDIRYVRVFVTPSGGGATDQLSPDIQMSSVPNAVVAETLQGIPKEGFLQLGAGSLDQSNVETIFSLINYPKLTSLLAGGTSTSTGSASGGGYTVNADSDSSGSDGLIDFQVRGSSKLAITDGGNVGIGTTAPVSQFANTNTAGADKDGVSVAATGISWLSSAAGYVQSLVNSSASATANGLLVKVAGTGNGNKILSLNNGTDDVFTVTGSGRVGIGTSSPLSQLDQATLGSQSAANWARIGGNVGNATPPWTVNPSGIFLGWNKSSGGGEANLVFPSGWTSAGLAIAGWDGTTYSEHMRVFKDGNVGIGTSAPGQALEVVRTNGGGVGPTIKLRNLGNGTADQNNIDFSTGNLTNGSEVRARISNYILSGGQGRLDFSTKGPGAFATAPDLTLLNGNVGIGSNNPTNTLHLVTTGSNANKIYQASSTGGTANTLESIGGSTWINLSTAGAGYTTSGSGDTAGSINGRLWMGSPTSAYRNIASIDWKADGTQTATSAPGRLAFSTTASGATALTERMRIANDGNVGIGTTNPTQKLFVNGNVQADNAVIGGSLVWPGWNVRVEGDNSANTLGLVTSNAVALKVISSGNVGIGSATPVAKLNVDGAIVSNTKTSAAGVTNIDFTTGNVQVSNNSTNNAAIKLCGLKDGGSYSLVMKAQPNGSVPTFTAFSDSTCTTAVTNVDTGGVSLATSSATTIYTLLRAGSTVYVMVATGFTQ
jgi:hypothetical protein